MATPNKGRLPGAHYTYTPNSLVATFQLAEPGIGGGVPADQNIHFGRYLTASDKDIYMPSDTLPSIYITAPSTDVVLAHMGSLEYVQADLNTMASHVDPAKGFSICFTKCELLPNTLELWIQGGNVPTSLLDDSVVHLKVQPSTQPEAWTPPKGDHPFWAPVVDQGAIIDALCLMHDVFSGPTHPPPKRDLLKVLFARNVQMDYRRVGELCGELRIRLPVSEKYLHPADGEEHEVALQQLWRVMRLLNWGMASLELWDDTLLVWNVRDTLRAELRWQQEHSAFPLFMVPILDEGDPQNRRGPSPASPASRMAAVARHRAR